MKRLVAKHFGFLDFLLLVLAVYLGYRAWKDGQTVSHAAIRAGVLYGLGHLGLRYLFPRTRKGGRQ